MDVIAQWVRTEWTKQSRGGTDAARRNAAPEAFLLPSVHPPLTHTVVMDEGDGFEPVETFDYALPAPDAVLLAEVDGQLKVRLVIDPYGMPGRGFRPEPVTLEPGQWARWQINYRFGGGDQWHYRLDTLNIAYGDDIKSDVFTTGTPDRYVDERARLR